VLLGVGRAEDQAQLDALLHQVGRQRLLTGYSGRKKEPRAG
jgi:hypothetical protein